MTAQRKVNQDMYARIFKLLMERPVSAHEISEKVGMHIVNAQGLMRTFKKYGVVHVYSWRPDSRGRDVTPVYVMGDGIDKPRRSMSRAEISRRYRERKQEAMRNEASRKTSRLSAGQRQK